jgi:hypothetical protein
VAQGEFSLPVGVVLGASGNVYVVEYFNSRVQVFGPVPTPAKATSWGHLKSLYR